ncbi:hypothetical protein G9A89_013898 [Geosiphon pyriformis]|nr:hypothetical protein G9A89_013898 [Geosiphon pyriformis]
MIKLMLLVIYYDTDVDVDDNDDFGGAEISLSIYTKQEKEESVCMWSSPSTPSCSDMSSPHSPIIESNPDYAVYHVPKGYDIVLVPKTDEPAQKVPDSSLIPPNNLNDDSSSDYAHSVKTGSKPMDIPNAVKQSSDIDTSLELSLNNSTTTTSARLSAYRKRKADKNYIPRPKNCFMAYREDVKEKFLAKNPGMNNKIVSVLAAQMWNNEPEDVKEYWRERAKQLKVEHKLKYPDYKFKPQKKKQNIKTPGGNKGPTKTIRKKPLGSDKQLVFTEGYTTQIMCDSDDGKLMYPIQLEVSDDHEDIYIQHLHKKALFGHYRASSVESASSWTSDSTASTPLLSPFVGSPASYSPPTFQFGNQLTRSQSALRYEAGNVSPIQESSPSIMYAQNLSSQQFMINEVDQLNHMYNMMDVNAHATLPVVDDGFVLDSSSSYDESSLRTTTPFMNRPLSCSPSPPEMSTTDYDLMAMGHFASTIPQGQGFYVDYEGSIDPYSNFNSSFDLSSHDSASSLAAHYAFALETPRRNSQQLLTEFQNGLRQQAMMLQGLLD